MSRVQTTLKPMKKNRQNDRVGQNHDHHRDRDETLYQIRLKNKYMSSVFLSTINNH